MNWLEAIADSNTEQKVSLLPQILEYGEEGIDYLLECLEDPELEVRAKAYQLLQNIDLDRVREAIANGLLFNPGDRVYKIRHSSMWFYDSFYAFHQPSKDKQTTTLASYNDYKNEGYKIIRFDEEVYVTSYNSHYIDYQQAKSAADSLHKKRISEVSITEFDLEYDSKVIEQWCRRHKILAEVRELQTETDKQSGICKLFGTDSRENIYWFDVENYLKSSKNIYLLDRLWQDVLGRFASVGEIFFAKKTYLFIDPYYSQISESNDSYRYYAGMDEKELLSEESEANMLLAALNNPKLEIRFLAYQLLRGFKFKKTQEAIHQGVKLNPGDRIYSVYQSVERFNDSGYYLNDSVSYTENLELLMFEEECFNILEEAELYHSKRLYCYVEKEEAEQKAEALHRELIKNRWIGGLGFEWEQKNTKLSLEEWLTSNLPNYQADFDDWENIQKAMDYLNLPENIELLSKFYKDGIGRFAFVAEEYIQQEVYLPIEKKLTEINNTVNTSSELIARPKGYQKEYFNSLLWAFNNRQIKRKMLPEFLRCGELGTDFLIQCLENSELEIRTAAYEILQTAKSEKAQQEISSGLLLNPGDVIYCVYQSAMWFTDSSYLVFDYIDDSEAFREAIYGKSEPDENDGLAYCKCKRLFCYVNSELAANKAQYLHQQASKKYGGDFIAFWWEKENPNFDLKQWCLKHQIITESEWNNLVNKSEWVIEDIIKKHHDRNLLDTLNRSKYIYHPNHIDVWCRDNDVFYDENTSNEHNYERILALLALPKNIELLSKFYQDGVGRFSFVREEIICQKTYIPINQQLDESAIYLVVKPKKYDVHAVEFLLKILNSEDSNSKEISQARNFLQSIDSDYLPF